jgi:hypothetical protein
MGGSTIFIFAGLGGEERERDSYIMKVNFSKRALLL